MSALTALGVTALLLTFPHFAPPKKYALFIGVSRYNHKAFNQPELKYPEADAKALGELFGKSGYTVDLLLGPEATRAAIQAKLKEFDSKGNASGVAVVGVFGHGVEYSGDKDAYFCPFDSRIREVVDGEGKPLFDAEGSRMIEPVPESLVRMPDLLTALRISPAGAALLLADCCRNSPNQARGAIFGGKTVRRAFGAGLKVSDLPPNVAAFFACSSGEEAQESKEWGHGAFTRCLLGELPKLAANRDDAGALGGRLRRAVRDLVATVGRDTQTVNPIVNGVVDLQLTVSSPEGLRAPFDRGRAAATQREWAEYLKTSVRAKNSLGMEMVLVPPGEFLMGSDESRQSITRQFPSERHTDFNNEFPQRTARTLKPFRIASTEATRAQFSQFVNQSEYVTDAERGNKSSNPTGAAAAEDDTSWRKPAERNPQEGHPVTHVSWNDAQELCRWLSRKEGKRYRLPTQVEWEYAARAGTQTRYWNGDDPEELTKVANVPQQKESERSLEAYFLAYQAERGDVWKPLSTEKNGRSYVLGRRRDEKGRQVWSYQADNVPFDFQLEGRGVVSVRNVDPEGTVQVQDGEGNQKSLAPGQTIELATVDTFTGSAIGTKSRDGFDGLAPVGSFPPNPFGLHDVHGNVWEWCHDLYDDSRDVERKPGPLYVIRGGCLF